MVNVVYQGSVLFIIFCSYNSRTYITVAVHRWTSKIHPRNIAKKAYRASEKGITSIRGSQVQSYVNSANRDPRTIVQEEKPVTIERSNSVRANPVSSNSDHRGDNLNRTTFDPADTDDDEFANEHDRDIDLSKPPLIEPDYEQPEQSQQERRVIFSGSVRSADVSGAAAGDTAVVNQIPVDVVEDPKNINVDWIGRWFIVPSYICIIISMVVGGWGFY